jgi:2,5-dioxopentanoate dehydrogenase
LLQPVLIDGAWRQAEASGTFTAFNPATGAALPEQYPISGLADIEQALRTAQQAVKKVRLVPVEAIAHFLETFAGGIEARSEEFDCGW